MKDPKHGNALGEVALWSRKETLVILYRLQYDSLKTPVTTKVKPENLVGETSFGQQYSTSVNSSLRDSCWSWLNLLLTHSVEVSPRRLRSVSRSIDSGTRFRTDVGVLSRSSVSVTDLVRV